jgi:hypothetical protein
MDDHMLDDPILLGAALDEVTDDPPLCTQCGRPLGESTDDQPFWPTGPMCGDCYQARQMDDEIWWSEGDGS